MILDAIIPSLFLSLTLGLFGPSQIFFTNSKEFSFIYEEALSYFILVTLALFIITVSILLLLRRIKNKRFYQTGVSLVFIIAFLLWLQGNVMVWNYGLFDGKPIDWNVFRYRNWIDGTVWIGFLTLAILKSKFILKASNKLSIFFIIIQVVYIVILAFRIGPAPSFKRFVINEDKKFSFSKKKNVIMLLLDATQADIFSEVLDEKQEYKDIFNGFTYFPDTLSGYATTYLSVPSLMTGSFYRNEIPIQDWIQKKYLENSIFKTLRNNGFRTEVYSNIPQTLYYDTSLIDNISQKKVSYFNESIDASILYLFDLALFRNSPNSIKRNIYNDQHWRLSNIFNDTNGNTAPFDYHSQDVKFALQSTELINANADLPVFKFYHLRGAHAPYTLTNNLKIKDSGLGIGSYKEQVRGLLMITKMFLDKLKAEGVYDNSMIIIFADHGVGLTPEKGQHSIDGNINLVNNRTRLEANPILLIKPIGSGGVLSVDNTKASLLDLPRTIADTLHIHNSFNGINILDNQTVAEERTRNHYTYEWSNDSWKKDYASQLFEYTINGNVYGASVWTGPSVQYLDKGIKIYIRSALYKYGSKIMFGQGGNSEQYKKGGWSKSGINFAWTVENNATLSLPLDNLNKDLQLKVLASPFIKQMVNIYCNSNYVGQWNIDKENEYSIKIPKKYIDGGNINLTFNLPLAGKSPFDLGINQDKRKLGIAVQWVILDTID